jgi:catechol 2,3-dioxygenase-like lactoylglutathione lyase family enzyme
MIELFKKPVEKPRVNPRVRAFGKARIDIARRASNRADWERLWKRSTYPFPFSWGESWKQCVEYRVDDFAAEVGFYIDILGLPVNAFDPDYAMFTSPNGEFFFSVVPVSEGESCTPPDAIRIQFMVSDILEIAAELERRGIAFEHYPQPCVEGSSLFIGYFRTPHGICIDLWGLVGDDFELEEELPPEMEEAGEGQPESRHSGAIEITPTGADVQSALEFPEEDQDNPPEAEQTEPKEEGSELDVEYEYVYEDDT